MKKTKFPTAIGLSLEGNIIHAVKVTGRQSQCEVDWVKSFVIPENADIKNLESDFKHLDSNDFEGAADFALVESESDQAANPNEDVFTQIVELTESGRIPIAIAVGEPQIYYNIFDKNWGLSGKKLIRKLIAESGLSKASSHIDPDSIRLVQMKEKRIVAISQEKHLTIYHRLDAAAQKIGCRPPKIILVDGVELSLINLIHEYQCPLDGIITILVHITPQTSRFVFLDGTDIMHISHLISEGSNSPDLAVKLYNRLQYELDNGNFKKIDSIILTGVEYQTKVRELFERYFGARIVKQLKLHSIGTQDLRYADRENPGPYAPALGVACRLCDMRMKCLYEVDLTPVHVRDLQNRLSLSLVGWALLLLFPLLSVGILVQIHRLNWELQQYETQLIPKRAQMQEAAFLEQKIDSASALLGAFEKTGVFLDSLRASSWSYGEFLARIMNVSQANLGTWFTELSAEGDSRMQLNGYALDRNQIPGFAEDLGAEISVVDVQEIRGHPVYRFELSANPALNQ